MIFIFFALVTICQAQNASIFLSSESFNKLSLQNDTIIIDTRDSNDFNEKGHFDKAHNFDTTWLVLFSETIIDDYLTNRLYLATFENVILYDNNSTRLILVDDYISRKFTSLKVLNYLINESFVENFTRELNYNLIISPEYLNRLLIDSVYAQARPLIFDISYGDATMYYTKGHIPTAIHINTDDVEEPPIWNRKDEIVLSEFIGTLGIETNNTEMIVLYGNPDPMAAYRVGIIFLWMGVNNIRILNGGFNEWLRMNYSIEIGNSTKRETVEFVPSETNGGPIIVDYSFVLDLVNNYALFWDLYQIVDIRSWDEYIGNISGYDDLPHKGRILYSVWGKAGSNVTSLEDYRNPDLTMRSSEEIREMWDKLGIDYNSRHLIFTCGSGWRAAEVYFYARVMGLEKVSLYDGGWYEWSLMGNNTFELGEPTDIVAQTSTTTKIINQFTSEFNSYQRIISNFILLLFCLLIFY